MRRLQLRHVIAGLAFAACSSVSSPNDVPIAVPLDLNAAILQTALADINHFGSVTTMLGVASTVPFPAFDVLRCPFNTIDNSFTCASIAVDGLVYSLKYVVYDSLGNSMPLVDPLRAAALRTVWSVSGTTATGSLAPGAVATVDHQTDVVMSGLGAPVRILNGSTRDRDLITTTSTTNIVMAIDLTAAAANVILTSPLSRTPSTGTITSVATNTTAPTLLPQVITTASAVLTYNGTDAASVVVRKSGEVSTCQVPLTGVTTALCVTTP